MLKLFGYTAKTPTATILTFKLTKTRRANGQQRVRRR